MLVKLMITVLFFVVDMLNGNEMQGWVRGACGLIILLDAK
jgi:hypothetical protein